MSGSPSLRDLLVRQPMQGGDFAPVLDSGGRWAAFCTRVKRDGEGSARYSASGLPSTAAGLTAHVVELETGRVHALGQLGASSWRPVFSPDGNQLAYYMAVEDRPPQLWIRDLTTQTSRPIGDLTVKPKLWAGDAPIWSPDGGSIFVPVPPIDVDAGVSRSSAGRGESSVSVMVMRSGQRSSAAAATFYQRDNLCAVVRVDVASHRVEMIVEDVAVPSPAVFQLSPTGEWLSYLSVYRRHESRLVHDLAVVRTSGGPVRVIASALPVSAEQYFLHSYLWHPTQDHLFWIEHEVVRSLDVTDPAAITADLDSGTGSPVWPMSFAAAGTTLIVAARREPGRAGSDGGALAIVDLASAVPIEMVGVPDGSRGLSIVEAAPGVTWQPDATTVATVRVRDANDEVALLALEPGHEPRQLWRGPGQMRPVGVGADGRPVVLYEDLTVPPDLFSLAPETNVLERLTRTEASFIDHAFAVRHQVRTSLDVDGVALTLGTTVIEPAPNLGSTQTTTIVIGYPGARCSVDANLFGGGSAAGLPTAAFLMLGFRVVLVDLPLGPRPPEATVAERITYLLHSQLEHATQVRQLRSPLALMGHSYGAYGVAAVLAQLSDFAAGIAVSGIYDLASYAAHVELDSGLTRWNYILSGQGRMGADPWADSTRYLQDSPFYRADQIAGPMLLIHGGRDSIYPAEESIKLYSSLEHLARIPAELAIYPDEGHDVADWSTDAQLDAINRAVEFLNTI